MTPATAQAIEDWLYDHGDWVTRDHLCTRWDIVERELRPRGKKAGLLDGFAISRSEGGYIHMDHATDTEFGTFINRKRSHGQREIDAADELVKRRLAGPRRPVQQELLTL